MFVLKTATISTLVAISATASLCAGESLSEKLPPSSPISYSAKGGVSSKGADLTPPTFSPIENKAPQWGVEIGIRLANSAFKGNDKVEDIIPMFYYESDRFFIRGTEGGIHLWDNDQLGFDVLTRYRFFDYPEKYDNDLDHNTFDSGLRAYWKLNNNTQVAGEILTDFYGRVSGTARIESSYFGDNWMLAPLFEVRGKSSDFNSRYYGLGIDDVNAGIDARVALKSRLHLWRNLHLEGTVQARWLDSNTRSSNQIDDPMEYMAYIGVGFFEEPLKSYAKRTRSRTRTLNAKPYIRVAQGWGNDSTLAQIFKGDVRKDKGASVNMTSVFYGHPLTDRLFDWPIETYLTTGIVHHYSSDIQDTATEFALGVKFFYTVPLPWRMRFGAAEGVSYVDSFTYYEENSLNDAGLIPSRLLNYVDLSVDLNLGDVFCSNNMKDLWLGYGIHHRSGIGGTSPTFGNISGGSNFNTLYLQWSSKF